MAAPERFAEASDSVNSRQRNDFLSGTKRTLPPGLPGEFMSSRPSELDGQINWPSDKGLFFRDTRVISNWSIYANGEPVFL